MLQIVHKEVAYGTWVFVALMGGIDQLLDNWTEL
jgi:hypothetical protein